MTRHVRTLSLAALLGGLYAATSARAQSPDDPSVTMDVMPAEIPVNGHVTIAGLGYPQPGAPISVTVTPPTGAPTTLSAAPDKTGRYTTVFAHTPIDGTYKVSARTSAKSTPATGEFTVHTVLIDIDEDVADNKSFLNQTADFVTTLKKAIADIPDSPARTEMEAKIDALDEETKQFPAQSAGLATALGHYKDMVTQDPDAATILQPAFDHLAQLDAQTKAHQKTMEAEIQASEKNLQVCDAIDHATEALKAVPQMIGIMKEPFQFAVSFMTSMAKSVAPSAAGAGISAGGKLASGLPKAAGKPTESLAENEIEMGSESEIAEKLVEHIPESLRSTPAYKFVVAESKSFLPSTVEGTKSPLDMFSKAIKLAGDVAAYANDQLFAKYCEKFEGHFTASMLAHFYSKPNAQGVFVEWWTYSTTIEGTLTLRYPKGESGKAVALSGQFEGGATRFTYKEDVFNSGLFGSMAKGGVVHLLDVPPAATDDASGGMVNSLASPTGFFIPVTGQFADGKITLVLGDARTDFSDSYTRAHTVYVVIAPSTLMLPVEGHFSLPYTNAHFILDHIVKGDFPVTQTKTSMSIEKKDERNLPANQNDAVYTIDLKACNPGCGGA
jgi:hypothetical protein